MAYKLVISERAESHIEKDFSSGYAKDTKDNMHDHLRSALSVRLQTGQDFEHGQTGRG